MTKKLQGYYSLFDKKLICFILKNTLQGGKNGETFISFNRFEITLRIVIGREISLERVRQHE